MARGRLPAKFLNPNPARSLVLSGSLERRIGQLERLLSPPSETAWARPGMPFDMSAQARRLLAEARRLAAARRYQAAVRAFETAEQVYHVSQPTIEAAKGNPGPALAMLGPLQSELDRLAPLAAHSEASRQAARTHATPMRQAIAAYWREQVERLAREILREKPARVVTQKRLAEKIAKRLQDEVDDEETHHRRIAAIRGVKVVRDLQPTRFERIRTILRSFKLP